jgi:hypothetical protein
MRHASSVPSLDALSLITISISGWPAVSICPAIELTQGINKLTRLNVGMQMESFVIFARTWFAEMRIAFLCGFL